jgi:hypothetical protein
LEKDFRITDNDLKEKSIILEEEVEEATIDI